MIPSRHRRRQAAGNDRGSGSLEFAVLSLAFLLLVFVTVQAALYYHARNVVKAEAEGTARAIRAYPTNTRLEDTVPRDPQVDALAQKVALEEWRRLDNSGDTTSRPTAHGYVTDLNQVHVTVSANPILLIPGLGKLTITATAGGPFEVFKRSRED